MQNKGKPSSLTHSLTRLKLIHIKHHANAKWNFIQQKAKPTMHLIKYCGQILIIIYKTWCSSGRHSLHVTFIAGIFSFAAFVGIICIVAFLCF